MTLIHTMVFFNSTETTHTTMTESCQYFHDSSRQTCFYMVIINTRNPATSYQLRKTNDPATLMSTTTIYIVQRKVHKLLCAKPCSPAVTTPLDRLKMMGFNRTAFFQERHGRFASTKRRGRAAAPKLKPNSEPTTLAARRLRQILEPQPTELAAGPRLSQSWQASHTNPFTYPRTAPPSLSEYPSYLPMKNWTSGDKRYTNSRCELVRGSLCKLIMELHFEGSGLHEIEQSLPELDTYGQREVPFDVHDINAIILACMHQGLKPETPHRADEWIVEDKLFWDNKHYMREKWRNVPVRAEESGVPDGWWVHRENARNRDWIREERMDLSIGPEYRETRWRNRGAAGAP